jgi:hypothetical protein
MIVVLSFVSPSILLIVSMGTPVIKVTVAAMCALPNEM